jgi:hypothetical protein
MYWVARVGSALLIIGHRLDRSRTGARQAHSNGLQKFLQLRGTLVHVRGPDPPTKENGTYWPNPDPVKAVTTNSSHSSQQKGQPMTTAQRLLLETLAGHMALLQTTHPRKANSITAKRARLYVRAKLRGEAQARQRLAA